MKISFVRIVAAIIFQLLIVTCKSEVIFEDATVCFNQRAVLTCSTVSDPGYLLWNNPGGQNALYNELSDISNVNIIDNIFETRLVSVSNGGMTFKSTATTIDPIINSTGERSLNCLDRDLLTKVASIHLKTSTYVVMNIFVIIVLYYHKVQL
jgi:hypothetical protein